jgi:dihydroorotate dehydrogenase (NAD+) catalytic subunit
MIEISAGKQSLLLNSPVIGASGAFGYAGEYNKLIDLSALGAMVTNPVSLHPRAPTNGMRVVPIDGGILLHTGLPSLGLIRLHRQHAQTWKRSPIPIIMHLIGHSPAELAECAAFLEKQDEIRGIEIGFQDNATQRDVKTILTSVKRATQLPVLAQLPLYQAGNLAPAAIDAGADALVIAGAPRGTIRDPLTGNLVGGRLYGPWIKAMALRAVGQVAVRKDIPVIACGGVHHLSDAQEYLDAGAVAVQIDSLVWIRPQEVVAISLALAGREETRPLKAFADGWLGETNQLPDGGWTMPSPPLNKLPPNPPEI